MSFNKGSERNPYRVLIADNWGADVSPVLKKKHPNIKFSSEVPTQPGHPHGHMVAECFCAMIPDTVYVDLVFYPYIELQRDSADGWMNVLKNAREAGNPFDICNCSFGAHHGNNDVWKSFLKQTWADGQKLLDAREKIGNTRVVFASGNHDQSQRGRPHMGNDVNYPQRPLSALSNVFVIGACDVHSIPSLFSSDGEEVFAMYWGEKVPVLDPATSRVVRVDGTSFASPFAAGDLLMLSHTSGRLASKDDYLEYVLRTGTVAQGWVRGDRHRKAGYGAMLNAQALRMGAHFPDRVTLSAVEEEPVAYLDFQLVEVSKPWYKRLF